jgi:hypothetical protein
VHHICRFISVVKASASKVMEPVGVLIVETSERRRISGQQAGHDLLIVNHFAEQ